MINTILQIVGVVFIIWLTALVIVHIIEYIVFKFSKDSDWCSITRDTYIYDTEFNEWYIIPAISIYFNFSNIKYPCFQISWLKWTFSVSYHIKRDVEEEAEAEARLQLIEEQNESKCL